MDNTINIIVIEDYPLMRRVFRDCLLELGFTNIFEADDGSTGLEIISRQKIDLIIADWDMPNTSGMDLYKVIKATDELKDIPFLMAIKDNQIDELTTLADLDREHVIIKPFTAEALGKKIELLTSR